MDPEVSIQPVPDNMATTTPSSSRASSGKIAKQTVERVEHRASSSKAKEFLDTLHGGFEWGKRGLVWSPARYHTSSCFVFGRLSYDFFIFFQISLL